MEERDFFIEARAQRTAVLQCSFCRTNNDYSLSWLYRKKRTNINLDRLDERDRTRFEKAASYMVLLDDMVICANPSCRRRFEISGVKTMCFVTPEQLEDVDFGRDGRPRDNIRGQGQQRGQSQQRNYSGGRAGEQRQQGYGQPRGGAQQDRSSRGRELDDNIGNRVGEPSPGGYQEQRYGQLGYGQQGYGQSRGGKPKQGYGPSQGGLQQRGNPSPRNHPAPRNTQPPQPQDAQPFRSPKGKRGDPTGPGGGWR